MEIRRETAPGASGDAGFTLVELLIVIVVLGLLATVTVFAVRGITDQGQESACAAELRVLVTAQETQMAGGGGYTDEAGLVAAGALSSESTMYEVTVTDGEYSIVPSAASSCTGSAGGSSGGAAEPAAAPAPEPVDPVVIDFGGFVGWEYEPAETADEVVVFGRAEGEADFLAMIAVAPPTSRRVTFLALDQIVDDDDIDTIMSRSRTNGVTDFAIYSADDTSPLADDDGGPAWPDVRTYLANQVTGSEPLHLLGGGATIEQLLLSIG